MNDIIRTCIGIKSEEQYVTDIKDDTIYTLNDDSVITFDYVYSRWMRLLYILISHIVSERDARGINEQAMTEDVRYQFFGLAESAADQLMYFFIKDQLSDCIQNKFIPQLCYHILFGKYADEVFADSSAKLDAWVDTAGLPESEVKAMEKLSAEMPYAQLERYIKKIICSEFNAFTVANFYDFYVNFWSGFENCISLICEDYESQIKEKLDNSRIKEMKKLLKQIAPCEEYSFLEQRLEEKTVLFLKKFGAYVSFPDKYRYLINDVIGDRYMRDSKRDVEILEFGGAMRNTMHNNGTHLKADREIEIDGFKFTLRKGEKRYSEDYAQIFLFAQEIFDIYLEIVDGLEKIRAEV